MKGEITLKILETIEEVTLDMADLCAAILNSGYGVSYGKLQYEAAKRRSAREGELIQSRFENNQKQKYYKLLYNLKKDGLIKEEEKHGKRFFIITDKGREERCKLKNKLIQRKELPDVSYETESGGNLTIVVFDIPESERRKRDWLREVLKNLKFKLLQKSVWVGKVKVPKKMIDDLHKLKLVSCVEIFEISKSGSLRQLT